MDDSRGALLEAWWRRRDPRALHALVIPEIGRALAIARSAGCTREDSEDVVQESLVRLVQDRDEAVLRVGLRARFFRDVRNVARATVRSGGRRRRRERAAFVPREEEPADARASLREEIERALADLDPDDREAIRLRFLLDLEYREMAHVLGVSEGACRVRVHRALRRLRGGLGVGVTALPGLFVLPRVGDGAGMVNAALAAAPATSTATAAGGTILMATTKQVLLGAAVAVTFTALGAGGATLLGTPPRTATGPAAGAAAPPSPGSRGASGETSTGVDPRPRSGPVAHPAAAPSPAAGPMADLQVRPDEWAFLREALLREREAAAGPALPADATLEDLLRMAEDLRPRTARALWDYEGLRGRIVTGGPARRFDAEGDLTPVDLGTESPDTAVLEFGAGRFELAPAVARWGRVERGGRRSLEIRGAGMDRTTLVVRNSTLLTVMKAGNLENLFLHDLTLDGAGESNFLIVEGAASAALERVRLTNGARLGFGSTITISGQALLVARGCEFLGSGGHSNGLTLRGRAVALIEDSLFRDLLAVVNPHSGTGAGGVVHLAGCTFENAPVLDARVDPGDVGSLSVAARGGTVRFGETSLEDATRRRLWGAPLLRYAEEISFGPGTPPCTLADLLAVAERVTPGSGEVVGHVARAGRGMDGRRLFGIRFLDAASGATRFAAVTEEGTPAKEEIRDFLIRASYPPAADLASCLPLAPCVRRAGIPPEGAAEWIGLYRDGNGKPLYDVRAPAGWTGRTVDAVTGEVAGTYPPR